MRLPGPRQRIHGYPLWAGYLLYEDAHTEEIRVRVVLHPRRFLLWSVLTGRVRVTRAPA
jgi:hypothetical protein